jgi:CNT family concentrative nucleoside transporter
VRGRALLALGLCAVAVAGSWMVPGLVGRGWGAIAPQAEAAPSAVATPPQGEPPAPATGTSLATRLTGLVGLAAILAIGFALSRDRRRIRWRVVAWGLGLQVAFAIFVLRVPAGQALFRRLGAVVTTILHYSYAGSEFVFGELGKPNSSLGVIFAFQILPAIIFVSALFAIMNYLGVMQVIVRAFAAIMSRVMGASGAESLNVAASIFMGQTEAPLTIRPFLPRMTRSELMTVMTSGMAHISGSIMAAYIAFGIDARHLLTAVIMTAPGTILMAKLMEPETETPETYGNVRLDVPKTDALHGWLPWFPPDLQTVLGWIFRPVAFLMGVPWHDSGTIGALLGTRMVLNEFIAYAQLGPMREALDPRSFTIASFALAGFANFSSVGIQLGGIGALAPERKHDLARLGGRG